MDEQEIRDTISRILQPLEKEAECNFRIAFIGLILSIFLSIICYSFGLSLGHTALIGVLTLGIAIIACEVNSKAKKHAYEAYKKAFPTYTRENKEADRILSSLKMPKRAANTLRNALNIEKQEEATSSVLEHVRKLLEGLVGLSIGLLICYFFFYKPLLAPDVRAYKTARDVNTVEAYRSFIKAYPNSSKTVIATETLNKMLADQHDREKKWVTAELRLLLSAKQDFGDAGKQNVLAHIIAAVSTYMNIVISEAPPSSIPADGVLTLSISGEPRKVRYSRGYHYASAYLHIEGHVDLQERHLSASFSTEGTAWPPGGLQSTEALHPEDAPFYDALDESRAIPILLYHLSQLTGRGLSPLVAYSLEDASGVIKTLDILEPRWRHDLAFEQAAKDYANAIETNFNNAVAMLTELKSETAITPLINVLSSQLRINGETGLSTDISRKTLAALQATTGISRDAHAWIALHTPDSP